MSGDQLITMSCTKCEAATRKKTLKAVGEWLDKKWESATEIVLTRELINSLKAGRMPEK